MTPGGTRRLVSIKRRSSFITFPSTFGTHFEFTPKGTPTNDFVNLSTNYGSGPHSPPNLCPTGPSCTIPAPQQLCCRAQIPRPLRLGLRVSQKIDSAKLKARAFACVLSSLQTRSANSPKRLIPKRLAPHFCPNISPTNSLPVFNSLFRTSNRLHCYFALVAGDWFTG